MRTCRNINLNGFPRSQLANTCAGPTLTAPRNCATCPLTTWTCARHLEAAVQDKRPRTRSTTRCAGRSFGSGLQSGTRASPAVDDRCCVNGSRSSLASFHERNANGCLNVTPTHTLTGHSLSTCKSAKKGFENVCLPARTLSSKSRCKIPEGAKSASRTTEAARKHVRVEAWLLSCRSILIIGSPFLVVLQYLVQ